VVRLLAGSSSYDCARPCANDAIRNQGWRGASCGYDADYAPIDLGRLRQTGITGTDRPPRCGKAYVIGDSAAVFINAGRRDVMRARDQSPNGDGDGRARRPLRPCQRYATLAHPGGPLS
jgi:hypothetical protein